MAQYGNLEINIYIDAIKPYYEKLVTSRDSCIDYSSQNPYIRNGLLEIKEIWRRNINGKIIASMYHIDGNIFELLLKYIYCGELNFDKKDFKQLNELYVAADMLLIDSLITILRNHIKRIMSELIEKDIIEAAKLVDITRDGVLIDGFVDMVINNPRKLFMGEIQEVMMWLNFNGLERYEHLLDVIRFDQIDDKVVSKQMMDDDIEICVASLYKKEKKKRNLIRYGNFEIGSDVVRSEELRKIIRHINQVHEVTLEEYRYSFELLYTTKTQGKNNETFHKLCDNRGPTLVVINTLDGYIGGYTSISWSSDGEKKNDEYSFIFHKGNNDIHFADIKDKSSITIGCFGNMGPMFGRDLVINEDGKLYFHTHIDYYLLVLNNVNGIYPLHYEVFRIEDYLENIEEQLLWDFCAKTRLFGDSMKDCHGNDMYKTVGYMLKFSLRNNKFPFITARRLNFEGMLYLQVMFMEGTFNKEKLKEKNIYKWWAKDIENNDGYFGRLYPYQMRDFGGDRGKNEIITDPILGFDQLRNIIKQIKRNGLRRDILISYWDPRDIK
ncbi:12675_t:CDS:2 [Dentiscutata heterogama]|uniref:12675_t:CDS:1 n=1 Tax=Dentiscutata heterogama TaxID=1316150 RepID=A0ACA9LA58_9GLOM|nr:12675_t:CDS:2 [Dentiscutata heterogama]